MTKIAVYVNVKPAHLDSDGDLTQEAYDCLVGSLSWLGGIEEDVEVEFFEEEDAYMPDIRVRRKPSRCRWNG
jgi:hypothetical protein